MTDLIVVALAITLAVGQWLVAAVVYIDARRLGLDRPGHYPLAIVVPLAGFVVVAVYATERTRLAERTAAD
ncbi:hypothetical protein [Halovivax cerinus]|uniref:Uncharacterized protein n=1 Tax=Halovivax cerinus TaxID=1487865 RepID=A0ABD5NQN7_9EURY|nr:hypothetical protein [Halovivax cerinus]